LLALFGLTQLDTSAVIWVIATTSAIAATIGLFSVDRPRWERAKFYEVAGRNWRFSKWLLLNSQLDSLGRYPPLLALAALDGSTAVGAAVAAANILGPLHVLYFGLDNVVQPTAARLLTQSGIDEARRFIRRMSVVLGIPVLTACAAVIMAPETLSTIFYGPELLAQYELVVALFGMSYFLGFLRRPLAWLLTATERTRPIAACQAVDSVSALVLCVPLIEEFGLLGYLGTILASRSLGLVVLVVLSRGTRSDFLSRERGEESRR
jgi:O-antigen/teichoic acid export membrane protein